MIGRCLVALALGAAACGGKPRYVPAQPVPPIVAEPPRAVTYHGGVASLSRAADAQMVAIAASRSIAGSTPEERQTAYDDWTAAAGSTAARDHGWFDREEPRHIVELPAFHIDLLPVTNAQYAEFVADGGAPAPTMDADTWARQGFAQDFATEVQRFVWTDVASGAAIQASAWLAMAVQVVTFAIARLVARQQVVAAWGLGVVLRFAVVAFWAFLGIKAFGLVSGPALLSLVLFFFVSTVIEPIFLNVG